MLNKIPALSSLHALPVYNLTVKTSRAIVLFMENDSTWYRENWLPPDLRDSLTSAAWCLCVCNACFGSLQALGVQGVADAHTLSLARPKRCHPQAAGAWQKSERPPAPADLSRPVGHGVEPGILSQFRTRTHEKRDRSHKSRANRGLGRLLGHAIVES